MTNFTRPIEVDLGDILAVVIGVVFSLLFVSSLSGGPLWLEELLQSDSEATDLLVGGSAFLMLHLKRKLWPGKAGPPSCGFLPRLLYLLAGILGSLFMVGSMIEAFAVSTREGVLLWDQDPLVIYFGMTGLGLTLFALILDRLFLNRSRELPDSQLNQRTRLE